MDAQNAVEPASTKPAASQRPGSDPDRPKTIVTRSPSASRSQWSGKDSKSNTSASRASNDDDGAAEGNSDAETIVLPGKDGHSPSKVRKIIKHGDKSDAKGNGIASSLDRKQVNGRSSEGDKNERAAKVEKSVSVSGPALSDGAPPLGGKKKKINDKPPIKDVSSGLSSAPTSPPHRRQHSDSESEGVHARSPSVSKDKAKSTEKPGSLKRKASRLDSDDEGEARKVRRQRTSGSGLNASRKEHQHPTKPQQDNLASRTRSTSPHPKVHRRSVSTQLPSQSSNGLSHKKKRIPAPLQSTDYLSDESSAGGSPHPRSSKLRSLTTPATTESTISPAKMAPHKKHLDAHGQTFLARACAKGEYDTAKQRLQERPEDINVADYAGNTPLQIAALNGFVDIVKLLVDAGCNLDCVNNDKDTPLIDAVENGHLEVVRILLNAGVNPRKANAYGEEPVARVNEETDNAAEIRQALREAKQKMSERRLTSEDHQLDHDARSSHGPDSPRRSPGAASSIHALASGRRAGTSRSTKTSNHLLYVPLDDKTLRAAAGRGDEELVTRILQIRDTCDDPESMVAAARGGHDIVMQLFLALGKANPDPPPISPSNEFSTPMLAAIGQENLKVVKLLLDQADFDPSRRFKGEAYHEIARRRRGPNWMEEETLLKDAYDEYKKSHKDISKNKSPNKREQDRESRRARPEQKEKDEQSKSQKRKTSSPTRDPKKANLAKTSSSPKEKRSNSIVAQPDDQNSPKRAAPRPKKDEKDRERDRIPTIAIPDREVSPTSTKHVGKAKRAESDIGILSSEGETVKPRRKLISGRELKGGKEKDRRSSVTSVASSMKEPSSPRDSRQDDHEKSHKTEKYHDRTKALKRDESRDRLSVSGENAGKRHRLSATPPYPGSAEKESGENFVKRRRLDVDGQEKRAKSNSADDRQPKALAPRDPSLGSMPSSAGKQGPISRDGDDRRSPVKSRKVVEAPPNHGRRESGKSLSSENSIHVKSEDPDIEMRDVEQAANVELEGRVQAEKQEAEEEKRRQAEREAQALLVKKEEERKRREEEEKRQEALRFEEGKRKAEEDQRREEERKRKEEEERKRTEEEERKRKEEEKRRREEEEDRRRTEEEVRRLKDEEDRRRREEEDRKRKQEEERKRLEEEERRRREEDERNRKEEEERKRREEEDKRKREEEERLRQEQLEREAAEEARRKQEEEERKRGEMKQRQALREAEQLEQERIRVSKLPPLLRWLDSAPNPKHPGIAEKFSVMQGVRFDCIRPEATGTPDGREQWLLNTQVALLLGQRDLELSQYTAWSRIPVSLTAKKIIWRLEGDRYALTNPTLYELGKQLPEYYGGEDPERMSYRVSEKLRAQAWEKFAGMDLFFVKASDLMFTVPNVHHLRNVKLTMAYRELPEDESQAGWMPLQKWKSDPDAGRFYGFAPSNKYFINGELIHEDKPGLCPVSTSPFPEKRVPRKGLTPVSPNDPDYAKLCREQGLDHLLPGGQSPRVTNGVHSSPSSTSSRTMPPVVNGALSPAAINNAAVITNGHYRRPISPNSESSNVVRRPLVNGIHGTVTGVAD